MVEKAGGKGLRGYTLILHNNKTFQNLPLLLYRDTELHRWVCLMTEYDIA